METTKKRKRDIDLPRIVYDAATRVFDRLFKEDSLEEMREVVRKKLGVPASTSVRLAQLRDGQTVDLEDDDDFEAFSSSAYKSSTAKVKVIVGSGISSVGTNGIPPTQPQTPPESADKYKSKAKDKKQHEALDLSQDQHRAVTPQITPSESPPLKKRRVSFAKPSNDLNKEINKVAAQWDPLASLNNSEGTPEQESTPQLEETVDSGLSFKAKKKERKKERRQKAAEAESSKEGTLAAEGGTPQPDAKKEKRRKKKKEKKVQDEARDDESTVTPKSQPVESANKPAKAKSEKVNGANDVATDDTAPFKMSKKRPRTIETDSVDKLESGKATTPNSSTESPAETENTEEVGQSTKKQKHVHMAGINADDDGANKIPAAKQTDLPNPMEPASPKTPKKSKIKSAPIIASEDPEPGSKAPLEKPSAEIDTPVSTKKAKRKSDAQPPVPLTLAEQQPAKELGHSSSQFKDIPPVVPEAVAPTEKAAAKSKSKKSSDVTPTSTEAKTPKKAAKKKTDTSEPIEDTREATRAAVQAVLARNGVSVATPAPTLTTPVTIPATPTTKHAPVIDSTKKMPSVAASSSVQTPDVQTLTHPGLLETSSDESIGAVVPSSAKTPAARVIVPSASQKTVIKVANAPISTSRILEQAMKMSPNELKKPPASAQKSAKVAKPSKCPVCGEEPWHVRSKCPIIKSGIRAMRKRIGELELELASSDEDDEDGNNEDVSATIAELHAIIEKRTKKPRASEAKQSPATVRAGQSKSTVTPAVKSVDASPSSTEVNVVSSSAAQPPLPEAEAEQLSERPVPSTSPPPSKHGLFIAQLTTSINRAASSTQPAPSIQPWSTIQPLPATQPWHSSQPPTSPPPPPPLSHKEPKKSRPSVPTAKSPPSIDTPILPSLGDLAHATTANLLGFAGDVSAISDHDLEELMRGPKLTSQDVPSEDDDDIESDEDQQEPDAVLEEDVVDVPVPKHASRMEYPSSSDEGGEDEEENVSDDVAVSVNLATEDADEAVQVQEMTGGIAAQPIPTPATRQEGGEIEEEEEEEEAEVETGQKSLQEMNLSSSSRSSSKAADAAVNAIVSTDLALPFFTPDAPSTSTSVQDPIISTTEKTIKEVDAVATAVDPESSSSQALPIANDNAPDPIEVDDDDELPAHETIVPADDTDEAPIGPKIDLKNKRQRAKDLLAKRQRTKATAANAQTPPPPANQTRTRSKDATVASQPEPPKTPATRKTRGNQLHRISELPVPVPPASTRLTRARATPAPAQVHAPVAAPVFTSTPRATRQRAAVVRETTAVETTAKGKEDVVTTAKAPATVKAASKVVAKQAVVGKQASKTVATRVTVNTRTRASKLAADLESAGEEEEQDKEEGSAAAPAGPEALLASWAVLPEPQSGPSQNDSDLNGTANVDELISSPAGAAGQETTAVQDPLFMHTESQSDLPYSQYPLPPSTLLRSRSASPNDSDDDDADEVAATVVRPRQSVGSSYFRSLTEIASQRSSFAPRYSSQLVIPSSQTVEPLDMFGRGNDNGEEDEESEESESESEGETPPVGRLRAAHFPQTRRAGASMPSQR